MSYPSFFLLTMLCLFACHHGDEVSTQELKINWIDRGEGDRILPGDFVLFTSTALGKKGLGKQKYEVEDTSDNGHWPLVFVRLHKKDSVKIEMKVDSLDVLRLKSNYEIETKEGQKVVFQLTIHDVLKPSEYYNKMKAFERTEIKKFLERKKLPQIHLDTSNFYLKIEKKSQNSIKSGQRLKVKMEIWDLYGNLIESSHPKHHLDIALDDSILPGIRKALMAMCLKDKAKIIVPFDLGFKDIGNRRIKPFTTLFIKLEVLGRVK